MEENTAPPAGAPSKPALVSEVPVPPPEGAPHYITGDTLNCLEEKTDKYVEQFSNVYVSIHKYS